MVRKAHVILFVLLTFLGTASATSQNRDVLLDTDALRVETIDGQQVMFFSTFRAESDDYTISGVSGKFIQQTNEMFSYGTLEHPAVLHQESESETVSITATETIHIHMDDERLAASGHVKYQSEDTQAESDLLRVDVKEAIRDLLDDAIDAMPVGEARNLVIQFFDRLDPDVRVVLLQGNVRVETEDASLRAAWMVFEESDSESFISVADRHAPLQLRVRVSDNDETDEDQDLIEANREN